MTEASEASGARRPKRKRVAEEAEEAEAEAAEVEVAGGHWALERDIWWAFKLYEVFVVMSPSIFS